MLGDAEADAGGGRIAGADLDIDIAHRRIERAGIGVPDLRVEWHDAGRRERHARQLDAPDIGSRSIAPLGAGEHHHAADALLETGRMIAKNEYRPGRADAEDRRTPGQIRQRMADPVTAGGQKDYASGGMFGGLIDGALDRVGIVRPAVAFAFHRDGARIGGCLFKGGGGEGAGAAIAVSASGSASVARRPARIRSVTAVSRRFPVCPSVTQT